MKSFSSIAKKYLKIQKKRTVLTCIGIILSVALITGSGTILLSIWDKFYRDAVASTGDYYAFYKDIAQESAQIAENHAGVEKSCRTADTGYVAIVNNGDDDIKKYLYLKAIDSAAFSMFPIKLLEGRLPQNANEIVLEKRASKYFPDAAAGRQMELKIGDRIHDGNQKANDAHFYDNEEFIEKGTRQYTVTGFVSCGNSYRQNLYYAFSGMDASVNQNVNVYVKLSSQVNIRNTVSAIANDAKIPKDKIKFNTEVLRYLAQSGSGNMDTTMITMFFILLVIITGASVAVIYNSFHISVLERISQFGLYRCIGATPRQIKGVILREAAIMAAVGIPIGILCGTLAIAGLFELFKMLSTSLPFGDLRINISPLLMVLSTFLGLATIYLSVSGPARRASKVSPMDALRNSDGYRKEKLKKITSKTGKKLLGVYGFVAWRNLRRNKKKLRVTVFSMALSIILYIVISTFMHLVLISGAVDANEYANYQIFASGYSNALLSQSETENLMQTGAVSNIYRIREMNVTASMPESKINQQRADIIKEQSELKNGTVVLKTNTLKTIGDNSMRILQKYIKEGTLEKDKMDAENGVLLVNTVSIYQQKEGKSFVFDLSGLRPGDEVEIGIPGAEGYHKKLKIEAVLTQNVLDQNYNGYMGFAFITTDAVFDRVSKEIEGQLEKNNQNSEMLENAKMAVFQPAKTMIQLKDKAAAEPVKKVLESIAQSHDNWNVNDFDEMAKNMQSTVLIISILFYGFITVIALIGALNIINTISTNILLRTRELSVLKAVGMTKRGLNILVYLESIYYSILSALYGGVIGTALSWLLFKTGGMAKDIQWSVPWWDIFTALAGAAVICLISGYLPLKRINNSIIVENIRQEQ